MNTSVDVELSATSFQNSSVRVTVLGDGGVGKSSLVLRYTQHVFIDEYDPTIEDSYRIQTNLENGDSRLLDILDTAGQEEFSAMRDVYMRTTQVAIIAFSINSRVSFSSVATIREQLVRSGAEEAPVILVGTKGDLDAEREVDAKEAEDYAKYVLGAPYFETSAKTGANVEDVFRAAAAFSTDPPKRRGKKRRKQRAATELRAAPRTSRRATHDGSVWTVSAVAIPDETFRSPPPLVVSGGTDGTVRLWSAEDGKPLVAWEAHEGKVFCVHALALTPERIVVVSGGEDGEVHTVDIAGQYRASTQLNSGSVVAAEVMPSGIVVAMGDDFAVCVISPFTATPICIVDVKNATGWQRHIDTTKLLWVDTVRKRVPCRPIVTKETHEEFGTAMASRAQSEEVVIGTRRGNLCIVNTRSYHVKTVNAHRSAILRVCNFRDDVYSCSADGTAKRHKAPEFASVVEYCGHRDGVNDMAVSDLGVFTVSRDSCARMFTHDGSLVWENDLGRGLSLRAIALSDLIHDDKHQGPYSYAACAGKDRTVHVLDTSNGKTIAHIERHQDWVNRIAMTGPMRSTVVTAGRDGNLFASSALTGELVAYLGPTFARKRHQYARNVDVLVAGGSLLVSLLQQLALPFLAPVEWGDDHWIADHLPKATGLDLFQTGLGAFEAALGTACAAIISYVSLYRIRNWKYVSRIAAMFYSPMLYILRFSSTFGLMIILRALLQPLDGCEDGLRCAAGLVASVLVVPIALRLAPLGGDAARIDARRLLRWRYDDAEQRRIHTMSQTSVAFSRALVAAQVIGAAALASVRTTAIALTAAFTAATLVTTVVLFTAPPFFDPVPNVLTAMLVGGNLVADVFSMVLSEEGGDGVAAAHLASTLIAWIAAALLMQYRLRILDMQPLRSAEEVVDMRAVDDGHAA